MPEIAPASLRSFAITAARRQEPISSRAPDAKVQTFTLKLSNTISSIRNTLGRARKSTSLGDGKLANIRLTTNTTNISEVSIEPSHTTDHKPDGKSAQIQLKNNKSPNTPQGLANFLNNQIIADRQAAKAHDGKASNISLQNKNVGGKNDSSNGKSSNINLKK